MSIDCARVMRGTRSSESAVTLRALSAASVSALVEGCRSEIRSGALANQRRLAGGRALHLADDVAVAEHGAASSTSSAPAAA